MALPKIVVRDRVIILLSGFDEKAADRSKSTRPVVVHAEAELLKSAKLDRDAVAFGYVGGKWISAA